MAGKHCTKHTRLHQSISSVYACMQSVQEYSEVAKENYLSGVTGKVGVA